MPFVETHISVVAPGDCDYLGHMNAAKYTEIGGQAVVAMQSRLGLGPSDMRDGRRLSFALVDQESQYLKELAAGDIMRMETAISDLTDKTLVFHHRLYRVEDDVLVYRGQFKCILMDLEKRRAVRIPDDVRKQAEAYLIGLTDRQT